MYGILFYLLEIGREKLSNKKIVCRVVWRIFARRWALHAEFPPRSWSRPNRLHQSRYRRRKLRHCFPDREPGYLLGHPRRRRRQRLRSRDFHGRQGVQGARNHSWHCRVGREDKQHHSRYFLARCGQLLQLLCTFHHRRDGSRVVPVPNDNVIFSPLPDSQPRFTLTALFAPGKTLQQTQTTTSPWITEMQALGINITVNWTHFDSCIREHLPLNTLFPDAI
jgi:hypothetical protein